jgi:hypothetical protein
LYFVVLFLFLLLLMLFLLFWLASELSVNVTSLCRNTFPASLPRVIRVTFLLLSFWYLFCAPAAQNKRRRGDKPPVRFL